MKKRLFASLLAVVMLLSLIPTTVFAVSEDGAEDETPAVCAQLEGCTEDTHAEGCPLYVEPSEGEDSDSVYEPEEVTDPVQPSAEEQLAGLIAALPAPADIDLENEAQVEAVYVQISDIYAFAEENDLDVEDDEIINAVIAALYPVITLEGDTTDGTLNGDCGAPATEGGEATDAVKWALTVNDDGSTYTLNISGSGAMADYANKRAPWYTNLAEAGATTTAYNNTTFANISKVVIGNGVTHISDYAFAYTMVSDIQIPDSVTSIGKGTFLWANWLKNITIPSSVENMHYDSKTQTYYNIFDGAFYLESMKISGEGSPYQVVQGGILVGPVQDDSGEYIIINCADNLGGGDTKAVTTDGFPEKTTRVAGAAFGSCRSLTSIVLPDSITMFDPASTFSKCFSLKEFKVPDSVTALPQYTFAGCESLTKVDFNNVAEVGASLFTSTGANETDGKTHFCDNLTSIELKNVKKIPGSFAQNSKIKSVTIANGAEITGTAFLNCTALETVTFLGGYTVTAASSGNKRPFQGCTNIKTVIFNQDKVTDAEISIEDNLFAGCTKLESIDMSTVSIKGGKIGENAFKGCTSLESVAFAGNTKTISKDAFSGCNALTVVDLSSSQVESIEQGSFQNCTSLTTLSFPENTLKNIGTSAFNGNKIQHITIPASVETVGDSAFENSSALTKVTMSKNWANKITNTVIAPTGYLKGLRWYQNGTSITISDSLFSDSQAQTFDYVPIFIFDVEYNGNYEDYSSQTHTYPYRYVYRASDMEPLTSHEIKESTDTALAITIPTGKAFAGWTTSADDIEIVAQSGDKFIKNPAPASCSTGDFNAPCLTLYARWIDSGKTIISNDVIDRTQQVEGYTGETKSFEVKAARDKELPSVQLAVSYLDDKGNSISPVNVGTYDVVISYTGNGGDSYADFKLTIAEGLKIENATLDITATGYSGTYDGQAHSITVAAVGGVTVTYSTDDTHYSEENPSFINAGSYTVYYKASKDNYKEVIGSAKVEISKAIPTISISADKTSISGGGTVKLTVTGAPAEGTVDVTCGSVTITKNQDDTYSADLPNEKKDYTFTARYTAAENGNYNDAADATCTVSVTRTGGSSSGGSSSGSSGSSGSSASGYAVTVDAARNGTVTVSPKNAGKGATVTITVKPKDGYELDGLTVTDKNGKSLKVTEGKNGKYTFTMPASKVNVAAAFTKIEEAPERSFIDVSDSYWAADAIVWAAENGYMNGNTASTFNPEGTVTRQQLWMILARLSGAQPADFAEAKRWAVDSQITDGTTPGGAVTRQQLVAILYRYAARMGYEISGTADLTQFPDHASVAAYATDAMRWSVANGIVGGTTQGTLHPNGTATRAQFAVILKRFCENIVK